MQFKEGKINSGLEDSVDQHQHHKALEESSSQVANLCDKCGSPKNSKQFMPPRIGRKRPQVNNTSVNQSALDRSEIL